VCLFNCFLVFLHHLLLEREREGKPKKKVHFESAIGTEEEKEE